MNIGSVPTVSSPFRKGHRLLVWRLRASGYALRPSSPHQQPILILIVAAFSSCLSPRTEQSYYRWRKEYGGLKMDQARRMKELEKENARLRRAVSDLTLDKLILQEAARGNF